MVGTDPVHGTMYKSQYRKTKCQCSDRMSLWNQGQLDCWWEEWGYLTGETNYIFCCVDASCRKSWLYPLCDGATARALFGVQLGEFANPILERASAMKESSIFSQLLRAWIRSARRQVMPCQLPRTFTPGDPQRNCVVTLSNQSLSEQEPRSRNSRFLKGDNLEANQQILILSDKVEEMPDMYGWTDENVANICQMAQYRSRVGR